jgi:hypothetical protein
VEEARVARLVRGAARAGAAAEEVRAAQWLRRARMAVEVRRGEKLLLQDIAADLDNTLES